MNALSYPEKNAAFDVAHGLSLELQPRRDAGDRFAALERRANLLDHVDGQLLALTSWLMVMVAVLVKRAVDDEAPPFAAGALTWLLWRVSLRARASGAAAMQLLPAFPIDHDAQLLRRGDNSLLRRLVAIECRLEELARQRGACGARHDSSCCCTHSWCGALGIRHHGVAALRHGAGGRRDAGCGIRDGAVGGEVRDARCGGEGNECVAARGRSPSFQFFSPSPPRFFFFRAFFFFPRAPFFFFTSFFAPFFLSFFAPF